MAAARLVHSGLKIVVLEKQRVPRAKACGGAVSKTTLELMKRWFSPSIEAKAENIRLYHNYQSPKLHRRLKSPIFLLDRKKIDHQLIESTIRRGRDNLVFKDEFRVTSIREKRETVIVHGKNQEEIQAAYLIGADGADSIAARSLGLNRPSARGFAIDASVELDAAVFHSLENSVQFNYYCIPFGYGWIFPKKGYLSCGIGSWQKPFPTRKDLDIFLKKSLPAASIHSVHTRAHPVPLYGQHRSIATRRVCLVGDAANLVHPLTGEGIHYALTSGALAADTLLELMHSDASDIKDMETKERHRIGCKLYEKQIHASIGREFYNLQQLALPLFLNKPDFFYRKFVMEGRDYSRVYQHLAQRMNAAGVNAVDSD